MGPRTAVRDVRRRAGPGDAVLAVSLAVLLLGGTLIAAGLLVVPDDCETQYGVSLERTNETNRSVVEAGNLSRSIQEPVGTAVRENRTVFVEPGAYRSELENRTIRFEGDLYVVRGDRFEDCAGGTDDLVTFAGFWLAVLGATVAALSGLYRYGSNLFPSDEEYRRRN